MTPENSYTQMQRRFYIEEASKWSPTNRDPVVGSFDAHNAHADYDLLFEGLDTQGKVALDFGCGPGRNLVKFANLFARIDGADIALENLIHARKWCELNSVTTPRLYKTNGVDLGDVPDTYYDFVFSTICLQHIPVHEIRLNLFREFFRVLKPGGWFTAQMGYGETTDPRGVDYYANKYDAQLTNGMCDVNVTNVTQLLQDLMIDLDFVNFLARIRPTGPGDWHPQWVFFRAQKPGG